MRFLFIFILSATIYSCNEAKSPNTAPAPVIPADNPADSGDNNATDCISANTLRAGIVGGQRVRVSDPDSKQAVMIFAKSKTDETYICTATPVSSHVLITAAHCLNEAAKVYGVFHADLFCETGFRFSQNAIVASDFKFHPDYSAQVINSSNPDIGLVYLSEPMPAGYPIFKISKNPEILNSDLYLYGYGITHSNSNDSAILRKTVVTRENYEFQEKSIVIKNNGIKGICQGDSGGSGLVKVGEELQIATINSFGRGPQDDVCGGESSAILVYPMITWIDLMMTLWGEHLQ